MLLSHARPVGFVIRRMVACELAADRTAMTIECARHLRVREALLPQDSEGISLCGGDLVISHDDSFLAEDVVSVPDRPRLRERVLHLPLEFTRPNSR